MNFADTLKTLPEFAGEQTGADRRQRAPRWPSIANAPGTAGSFRVYAHLAQQYGAINVEAAAEGLAIFAEHTEDASTPPRQASQHRPPDRHHDDGRAARCPHHLIAHKIPVSVLVVIYTADGQVLLMERADAPGLWQSVTGSQDAGETLEQTAIREVREETGLDATRFELTPGISKTVTKFMNAGAIATRRA